jgi:hypothetical protein
MVRGVYSPVGAVDWRQIFPSRVIDLPRKMVSAAGDLREVAGVVGAVVENDGEHCSFLPFPSSL